MSASRTRATDSPFGRRYRVGSKARFAAFARAFFPAWLFDFVLRREFRLG